jgi:hypothetical protein
MSGARPPRARLVPGGCPSPPGECSAARTAGTATSSRRPTSPPEAASPSPLPTKQGSRTAARAGTCQAPACRDVTPGAGPNRASTHGSPGRHRPAPHTTRWTGSRSPNPRGARQNVTPDEFTSRCTKHATLYCAIVIGGLALLVLGALRRGKDAVAQRRCHRSPACLIQARTGGPSRSGRPPPPTTRGTNRMDLKPTEFG